MARVVLLSCKSSFAVLFVLMLRILVKKKCRAEMDDEAGWASSSISALHFFLTKIASQVLDGIRVS